MKHPQIPEEGLKASALREARAGELGDVISLVERAIRDKIYGANSDRYLNIEAMYLDKVVVRNDGRSYAYPYTIDESNQVTIGDPVEVVREHVPVAMRESVFVEAQNESGSKWLVRVIRAGLSLNQAYYPDAVLREAVSLFDGARVFVKSDDEHIKGKGKDVRNLIGRLSSPRFVEGASPDTGEIQAVFDVLESAGEIPAKMREAFDRNMHDIFGFSIDVKGQAKTIKGKRVASKFTKVMSVDMIVEPGAGGELISLIEAFNPQEQSDMKLRERMIEAVKAKNGGTLPDGLDVEDDDALETAYREALNNTLTKAASSAEDDESSSADVRSIVSQEMDKFETRQYMREAVMGSNLPARAKQKIRNQFGLMSSYTAEEVDKAIQAEREYLASFTESGKVEDLGEGSFIETTKDRADKVSEMLDAFFDPKDKKIISFKECYIDITGDRKVTGHLQNCDESRMRESFGGERFLEALNSASFSSVLGNSITRRMVAEYGQGSVYDVYRHLVNVVPVNDFRTQERTRFGGYGDLPTVAEDGAYGALTSPSDEKATYAVGKKGGTETISIEMIKNDDVGAIQRIPVKLARAAKRTLAKFVLDFIATNPTIYDSVAWFHASHNNLGAAALDAATLAAARLAMLKQTEAGSSDRLGIPPMHLWVSVDNEEAAYDLFRRTTNNDTDFVESLQMQVHPVWYWTDANDWAVTADTADIPVIELGFLDGNEEPELFVQDTPNQGSLFSNDQIKYKIRHTYGGTVKDFRGGYKAVVI